MLRNVLYGITHTEEGLPIIREPRLVKVSIGLPKGRAIYAYKAQGKWLVRVGFDKDKLVTKEFEKRQDAERFYYAELPKAPMAKGPRKNNFFLFTRKVQQADGTDHYEPAWDVIEAHGDKPTALPVLFLDDDPFAGEYAMWSATELKCHGDGKDALRVLSMASTPEEKKLAEAAKADGERFFPIVDGCWTRKCPFSKPVMKGDREYPSPCKPSLDLKFQLAKSLRVGGTCYFHSGGMKSISQTFSAIERIRSITRGRIAGIPLIMSVSSYKTNHNGQAATQYGVSFEFRAEDVTNIQKALLEQSFSFQGLLPAPPKLIEAGEEEVSPLSASDMAAEFYPVEDDEEEQCAATEIPAATATRATAEDVVARMAAAKVAGDAAKDKLMEAAKTAPEASIKTTDETVTGEVKAAEASAPASAQAEKPTSAAEASPSAEQPRKRKPVF